MIVVVGRVVDMAVSAGAEDTDMAAAVTVAIGEIDLHGGILIGKAGRIN
jgi:hypothetical protein